LEEDVMSRVERFSIKNAMIIANLISNVIGVAVVILLGRISSTLSEELLQLMERTNFWFIPLCMLLPLPLLLIYERPIRKHFEDLFDGRTSLPEAVLAARRRLLNEPFFLIFIDFSMWIAAAIVYSMVVEGAGAGTKVIQMIVTRSLLTGLITVTVAFFVLEFVLQRRLEDHPGLAVEAAQEMKRRLRTLNGALVEQGYPPLSHGIGIHTGEVVAANIGSPDRLSYTLVGDTVNLASRLQNLNKEMGTDIILSSTTKVKLAAFLALKPLPPQRVKGKSQSVEVYTLASG
jgi:adenylate cyclase